MTLLCATCHISLTLSYVNYALTDLCSIRKANNLKLSTENLLNQLAKSFTIEIKQNVDNKLVERKHFVERCSSGDIAWGFACVSETLKNNKNKSPNFSLKNIQIENYLRQCERVGHQEQLSVSEGLIKIYGTGGCNWFRWGENW